MTTKPSKRRFPLHKWTGSLAANAVVLGVVLFALIPFVNNGAFGFPDEALYTAQADALDHGSWSVERPAADIDPDGMFSALGPEKVVGDKMIPYSRRPLYPVMLAPFWSIGGTAGAMVLSTAGALVAAVFGALIAGCFDKRFAIPTLWLLGLGSPLLFDAYWIVAHGLAAGAAAAMAYFAIIASDPGRQPAAPTRWRRTAPAASAACLAAALLVLLRSEGVLIAGIFGGVIAVSGIRPRRWRPQFAWGPVLLGLAIGTVASAAYVVNNLWARAVTPGSTGDVSTFDRQPDAVWAAWTGLIRPWFPNAGYATASMTLVVVCCILAPVAARFLPRRQLLSVALLCIAAVAAGFHLLEDPTLISGLLACAPWLLLGGLSLRKRDVDRAPQAWLVATTGLATLAILLTSYGVGGAAEWGGRFFHPLLPLIGPVCVIGLSRLLSGYERRERIVAVIAVGALALSMAGSAVLANRELRIAARQLQHSVFALGSKGGAPRTVVLVELESSGGSRQLWQAKEYNIELLRSALIALPILLHNVPADRQTITLITSIEPKLMDKFLKQRHVDGWTVVEHHSAGGFGFQSIVLRRST